MKRILFLLSLTGLLAGCAVENINYITPVMVTYMPENVQTRSASLGGIVLGEGGKDVTEYGLVYATTNPPTTADNKIAKGSRIGDFYDTYENIFQPETTYYYRSYGINEVGTGYGETYSFTTQGLPACNPAQNNKINTGIWFNTITINDVDKHIGNETLGDGNIEFEATGSSTGIRIFLSFNEINRRLPLTGTYTIKYGFDSQSPPSVGEVEVFLWNYASQIGGAEAELEQKIYVENNNGVLTFIFCDIRFNEYYTLNGKYTYTP
jgi:hypothetical protein